MFFAFVYTMLVDPLLRNMRASVPELSGMKAGDRVLDVCCGTGAQAIHYARKGMIATGIDLSTDMLGVAERSSRKFGSGNITFQVADALNLPFADDSFDFASVSFALHEKGRQARDGVVSEMRRVVKPGGGLVFIDFRVPLPRNLYACLARAIERMVGGEHHRYFRDYLEQGGLMEILKRNHLAEQKLDGSGSGLVEVIKVENFDPPSCLIVPV